MGFTARDLMQQQVGVVEATASLAELERQFDAATVSGFPVVDAGRLVGVVTRADVIRTLAEGARPSAGVSDFYAEHAGLEAQEIFRTFAEAAAHAGERVEGLRVQDVMTRSIVAVSPDDDLVDVARALASNCVHRVLVVEDAALSGIISSLDLVRLVAERKLAPVSSTGC